VAPGMTLGPMVRRLGLEQGAKRRRQLAEAQAAVLHAALEEIEALASDDDISSDAADRLSGLYHARLDRLAARHGGGRDGDTAEELRQAAGARKSVIAAQRRRLSELRRDHRYPADTLREIERDLDLDEERLR